MTYQDQGFCGIKHQTTKQALNRANQELNAAIAATPIDELTKYRSVIRWERDGYAWYWLLK